MAPRKKQSDSERLKKREAEKKRQEKIKQDPERLKQEKIKQHEKYLKKLQKGQRKLINDQSDREKRKTRKKWRDATNRSRQRKNKAEEEEQFLNENSPPPSENGSPLPAEPPKADGRGSSGRKRMKRNKTKCYRDLEELKLKYKKSTQKAERYKKRYLRLLKSTEMGNTVSTPRTKVKQLLKALQVGDWVVVTYDSKNYPGEIVSILEEGITINAMQPSGPGGWIWPAKPDIHTYPNQDLVKRINPPLPSGNRASQFVFTDTI
ncbi:hypothetical protein J6590_041142 [Homalodisca vitripennis]|nr:hypothetical protein J6590_041142 [Homalodisca vitripennis]